METIFTQHLRLRPVSEQDRTGLVQLCTNPLAMRYMNSGVMDEKRANSLVDKIFDIYKNGFKGRYFKIWAIEQDGNFAGIFELKQTDNTLANELEVVYYLQPSHWGRGIILEILEQAIAPLAQQLGKRLIATVFLENEASIKVLRKFGIESEGWMSESEEPTYKIYLKAR